AHASNNPSNAGNVVTLTPGQMVEVTTELPPGGYQSQPTQSDLQRASIDSTDVPDLPPPGVAGVAHPWHWVLLVGAFAGAAVGLTFAVDRGTTTAPVATRPGTTSPPGTPPQQCQSDQTLEAPLASSASLPRMT